MDLDLIHPSTQDLRINAQKRIPTFALEYLDSTAGRELELNVNRDALDSIGFMPRVMRECAGVRACGRAGVRACGRAFQYAVAAFSARGIDHLVHVLKSEIEAYMSQLGAERLDQLAECFLDSE